MTVDAQTLERVVEFHGHMCPGLALGVRPAEVALAEIGPHSALAGTAPVGLGPST